MENILYELLISNKNLIELLGSDNNIYPIFATHLPKSQSVLEYEYRDIKKDLITTSNFSINIIGTNYDMLNKIKEEIFSSLLIQKDYYTTYKDYTFSIQLSGGSAPLYREDTKLYQITINFLIYWRKL